MIIKTNDTQIPKGFLLNKDYLLSKLFLAKKKKMIAIKTISFQSSPIETNLYLQINKRKTEGIKARNLKNLCVLPNFRNKLRLKKAFLPNFSSIDFHHNYQTKGEFALGFMEDDLNITSINSKKFYYTNLHHKSHMEKRIEDHNTSTHRGQISMIASLPKFNYVYFSNEKLKQFSSRPVTGTPWFQTELPKTK